MLLKTLARNMVEKSDGKRSLTQRPYPLATSHTLTSQTRCTDGKFYIPRLTKARAQAPTLLTYPRPSLRPTPTVQHHSPRLRDSGTGTHQRVYKQLHCDIQATTATPGTNPRPTPIHPCARARPTPLLAAPMSYLTSIKCTPTSHILQRELHTH